MRRGYVSVKAAADLYGVVIDTETFELGEEVTAQSRAKRHSRMEAPLFTKFWVSYSC